MASLATIAAISTLSSIRFQGHPDIFEINDPRYAKYKDYKHLNGKSAIELYFHGMNPIKAIEFTKDLKKDSDEYKKLLNDNKNLYPTIKKLNGGDDWQKNYTTEQEQKALTAVQNKLNSSLATLANEYNDRINILGTNEDTLTSAQQYMAIQNSKLRDQLKKIYTLEDNIRTKQRLTQINTDHYKRQIVVSNCLKMLLPVIFLIIICVGAYLGGKVSLGVIMGVIIVIVILYGSYVWYKLREMKKPTWQRNSIKKDFAKIGKTIYSEGNKLEKEFIDENCDCPSDRKGKKNDKGDKMRRGPGSNDPTNNGPPLLYNDGSSPTEIIYPAVTSEEQSLIMNADNGMVQKIQWEDRRNCSYDQDCGKPGNPRCCLDDKINSPYRSSFTWTAGL